MPKLLLILLTVSSIAFSQWRDSSGTRIPSPAGYPVKITQFAVGDTNTRKTSGSIAYTNGGFYAANGSYYVKIGPSTGGGSVGNADSLGGLPASSYLLKADSAKVSAGYGISVAQSNHTATVSADTTKLFVKTENNIVSDTNYYTARQNYKDLISSKTIDLSSAVDITASNSTGTSDLIGLNLYSNLSDGGSAYNVYGVKSLVRTGSAVQNAYGFYTEIGDSTAVDIASYGYYVSGSHTYSTGFYADMNGANGVLATVTGSGLTTGIQSIRGEITSSYNTTGGAITGYAGLFSNGSSRSSGANTLTNIGIYGNASTAQINWAGYFDNGNVYIKDTLKLNNSLDTAYVSSVSKITSGNTFLTATKQAKDYKLTIDTARQGFWTTKGFLAKKDIDSLGTISRGVWNGTSIDTAYTNAVSKLTAGYGITVTKQAKDYKVTFDSATVSGKYVPYTGANASVNLGAQTLTTTGAGSFGAISGSSTALFGASTSSNSAFAVKNVLKANVALWQNSTASATVAQIDSAGKLFTKDTVHFGGGSASTGTNLFESTSAKPATVYRSISAVAGTSRVSFDLQTANGTRSTYGTIGGYIQSNSNSLPSGGVAIQSILSGTAYYTMFSDSLGRTAFGANTAFASIAPSATSRLSVTNGLFSNATVWFNSRGTQISNIDSVGRLGLGGASSSTGMLKINNGLYLNTIEISNSRATSIAKIDSNGSLGGTKYLRDSAAFSGTGQKIAIYIQGATKNDYYVATPGGVAGSGTAYTAPSANDILMVYPKTDSLIIYRPASGTSGLKVYYMRMN